MRSRWNSDTVSLISELNGDSAGDASRFDWDALFFSPLFVIAYQRQEACHNDKLIVKHPRLGKLLRLANACAVWAICLQRFPVACSGARSVWSAASPDTAGKL